jgi:hypothetical protein
MGRKNTKIGRRIRRGRDNTPRLGILDVHGLVSRGIHWNDKCRRIGVCWSGLTCIS